MASLLFTTAAAAFGLTAIAGAEPARRPVTETRADVAEALVGTWRLKATVTRDQSGNEGPFYEDPVGKLTYAEHGDIWALTGSRGQPGVWYTGTFQVTPKSRSVIHHVEYSSILDWEGSDQVRRYKFLSRNRLRLTAELSPTTRVELTWKRA